MSQAGLYYRTIRHLTPNQMWHLAARRLRLPLRTFSRQRAYPVPSLRPVDPGKLFPESRSRKYREMLATGYFDFLNHPVECDGRLPWEDGSLSELWKLNLHYFDYADLAFSEQDSELRDRLVTMARDWLTRNPVGHGTGWMPFAVSLRVVNWLKFLVRNPIEAARPELAFMRSSLWEQVAFLERNLEFQFGANHLLKNAKTLLYAGALLSTPEAGLWWATGERLLAGILAEQILPDGGHYERSPMYHLQVLGDLLDLQMLSAAARRALRPEALLAERIATMTAFARAILHPDGEIPLFNDSAFGGARPAGELLSLAVASLPTEAAQASSTDSPPVSSRLTVLAESGYAVIRDADSGSCLIFDCGPLGPDYNPAHGHCDVLSYELSLHGQRVVTDSGVSTYERGPERQYERSTAAHNTVRVDGEEQAEVWASFRVGRRPRVGPITGEETQSYQVVRGKHFGYQHRGVVHSRAIIHTPAKAWVIVDSLTGSGEHQIESFIHFHPAVAVAPERDGENAGQEGVRAQFGVEFGGHRYRLMTLGPGDVALGESSYSPEFGRRERRRVISWTAKENAPKKFVYVLVPEESRSPVIGCGRENAIEIDGAPLVVN